MQHQKQNVLARAKHKQMRPQRHLARKIKPSLRRIRQRPRKLNFAHRANRKPKARRFPGQNLLPRHPKPLREDRAQALMALNNIPKRSSPPPHPPRGTVTPPPPPPTRSKTHSRRCPYHTPPSEGRSSARTAGRAAPASPNRSTSAATVGASNRLRIDTSTSRLER